MRLLAVLTLFALVVPSPVRAEDKVPPPGTAEHDEALRRAQVWFEPAVSLRQMRLGDNPRDKGWDFEPGEQVECVFKPDFVSGSTPKFECERPGGKKIKVKYGRDNKEIYAEVVASRLLSALGFPADRLYVVGRIRCFGCPADPFAGLQCMNEGRTAESCFPQLDTKKYVDFDHAVIERRLEGEKLETKKVRGWGWNELSKIDAAAGGAPRKHLDALRLLAMFLNHWDNKPKNQRLLCLDEESSSGELPECRRPVAMVQDLGGTFGPFKFDVNGWAKTPVWKDSASCTVSMRRLPYGGSSFPDVQISEEGRLFLATRLAQLSRDQLLDLFESARAGADTVRWVDAFEKKARSIIDHPPCPATN